MNYAWIDCFCRFSLVCFLVLLVIEISVSKGGSQVEILNFNTREKTQITDFVKLLSLLE